MAIITGNMGMGQNLVLLWVYRFGTRVMTQDGPGGPGRGRHRQDRQWQNFGALLLFN